MERFILVWSGDCFALSLGDLLARTSDHHSCAGFRENDVAFSETETTRSLCTSICLGDPGVYLMSDLVSRL